jgi:hypothetical protein
MDQQQEELSKQREKMLEEGTKPSGVKTKVLEPVLPPTPDKMEESLESTAGPDRVIPVPKGITLVEEPRIVSEGGQLIFEAREVSTGGLKHGEIEPSSFTPIYLETKPEPGSDPGAPRPGVTAPGTTPPPPGTKPAP